MRRKPKLIQEYSTVAIEKVDPQISSLKGPIVMPPQTVAKCSSYRGDVLAVLVQT